MSRGSRLHHAVSSYFGHLGEDAPADGRSKCVAHDEVHSPPQGALEFVLQSDEGKQCGCLVEGDQDVDVAAA